LGIPKGLRFPLGFGIHRRAMGSLYGPGPKVYCYKLTTSARVRLRYQPVSTRWKAS